MAPMDFPSIMGKVDRAPVEFVILIVCTCMIVMVVMNTIRFKSRMNTEKRGSPNWMIVFAAIQAEGKKVSMVRVEMMIEGTIHSV